MDPVNRFSRDVHGSVESDGEVGSVDIVVDGLWNCDDLDTLLSNLGGSVESTVTTNANESLNALCFEGCHYLFHSTSGVRVEARGSKHRATGRKNVADIGAV